MQGILQALGSHRSSSPRARDSRARSVFGRYEIRVIQRRKPQLLHAVNAQDEDACGAQPRNEREIRGDDQFQAHHPDSLLGNSLRLVNRRKA